MPTWGSPVRIDGVCQESSTVPRNRPDDPTPQDRANAKHAVGTTLKAERKTPVPYCTSIPPQTGPAIKRRRKQQPSSSYVMQQQPSRAAIESNGNAMQSVSLVLRGHFFLTAVMVSRENNRRKQIPGSNLNSIININMNELRRGRAKVTDLLIEKEGRSYDTSCRQDPTNRLSYGNYY